MKCRLAALLACALIAFGQAPTTRLVDLVALDASGRPVTDLSLQDFEVTQSGHARTVTQVTWFDTRSHTARGSAPAPLALAPDEIRRNFIAIVDDLSLPPASLLAVQEILRRFVKDQMASGDRMAVLRASSGSGVEQQLTGDHRLLGDAIEHIDFLGGETAEGSAGGACWLTLRHAVQGVRHVPGRKFLVVFSQNLRAAGTRDQGVAALVFDANAAMATVYAVDLRGPITPDPTSLLTSPLEILARETGGVFGGTLSALLQAEEGFYSLGFEEAFANFDALSLKSRREGVTLRARSGRLTIDAADEFPAPVDRAVQIRRALASPFEGSDIHARLTTAFTSFAGTVPAVDAAVVIDARSISMIRDAKGTYRGSVRLVLDATSDTGVTAPPVEHTYDVILPADAYEKAVRGGLLYTGTLRLPAPGAWRIRALVADGASDRLGAAAQFIEVPARGGFSISSLLLQGYDPSGGKDNTFDPGENGAVRIFKKGRTLEFGYYIFNALADEKQDCRVEVVSHLYAHGHSVFTGAPSQVVFPRTEAGTRRQIMGRLSLAPDTTIGDYLLVVTAIDKLAPPGAPRSYSRFIDFQVRD